MPLVKPLLPLLTLLLAIPFCAQSQDSASLKKLVVAACQKSGIEVRLDQPYAGNNNLRQCVDLYLPAQRKDSGKPLPVLCYIHGGGWKSGDRLQYSAVVQSLVKGGDYAAVGIGYRLTDEAGWPAQIHDCKAAIRWVRGHAKEFNLDPGRIGILGASAGGHLASLLGTSGGVAELEGTLGEFTTLSSRVSCVVNQCGPQDFTKGLMLDRSGQPVAASPLIVSFLGGTHVEKAAEAIAASPITYVTADDPPFLTIHGTADEIVHFSGHGKAIHTRLRQAGVPSSLISIMGGDHASPAKKEPMARAMAFFDKHLRGATAPVDTSAIHASP